MRIFARSLEKHMFIRNTQWHLPLLLLLMLVLYTNCSDDTTVPGNSRQDNSPQAISFSAYVPTQKETRSGSRATRAADDWEHRGYKGLMDLDELKVQGFGVFGHYSGQYQYWGGRRNLYEPGKDQWDNDINVQKTWWSVDGGGHGDQWPAPNFFYNQHVTWASDHWTYSPVKYWPNEAILNWPVHTDGTPGEVDDQDPAATTEYGNGGFLSLFAYAPYVNNTSVDYDCYEFEGVFTWNDNSNHPSKTDDATYTAALAVASSRAEAAKAAAMQIVDLPTSDTNMGPGTSYLNGAYLPTIWGKFTTGTTVTSSGLIWGAYPGTGSGAGEWLCLGYYVHAYYATEAALNTAVQLSTGKSVAEWEAEGGTIPWKSASISLDRSEGYTANYSGKGLQSMTSNHLAGAIPNIGYEIANRPADITDLLLGVNGTTGWSNADMTKQPVNGKVDMKFIHALARVHFTVRAVVDEILPGSNALDGSTKIEIQDVRIKGPFPTHGQLLLCNGELINENYPDSWVDKTNDIYFTQFVNNQPFAPYWSFQTHQTIDGEPYKLFTRDDLNAVINGTAPAATVTAFASFKTEINAWVTAHPDDGTDAWDAEYDLFLENILARINNHWRVENELILCQDESPRFNALNSGGVTEVEKNLFTGAVPADKDNLAASGQECILMIPTAGYTPSDVDYKVQVHYLVTTTTPSNTKIQMEHFIENHLDITLKWNTIYTWRLLIGMESLGIDVEEEDWDDGSDSEIWMPKKTD